jgi:hypothetical protein
LLREPSATRDLLEARGLRLENVREAALTVTPATSNWQFVGDLRGQFAMLRDRLKPELEPAVVYSVGVEKAQ